MSSSINQSALARRLNLTQSTVSRALRGRSGVCPEIRRRILHAARALGYELPRGSVSDESQKQKTGIICVDIPYTEETWQKRLLNGVIGEATASGQEIIVAPHSNGNLPQVVTRGQVDGLIRLLCQDDLSDRHGVVAAPVPTVSVFYPLQGADVVSVDHFGSMRQLGLHLGGLHPRIAAFVGIQEPIALARFHGVSCGLRERGASLPLDLARFCPTLEQTCVMPLVGELLDLRAAGKPEHQFTLIVFYNDYLARHAISVIRSRGLRVPEDIGVTGYDDVEHPIAPEIRLTTVRLPIEELGRMAIRRIHARMIHLGDAPQHLLIPTSVVEGNSVVRRE